MFKSLFSDISKNFLKSISGYNALLHIVAIVITAILVYKDFDWIFFEATRSNALKGFIMFAGVGGFFVPVLVPVFLYFFGELRKNVRMMIAGAAVGQASILGILISSIYKAFTGRIQPEFLTTFNTVDISKEFHFGFWGNGIFWGWPSSHAAVAVAGAVALIYIYSKNKIVACIAILYALFISLGAAVGFHWFSDVIAGILIGIAIGMTVGRSFRARLS